ncbi:hypothetical protein ACWIGI_01655 [Nocardia sp. NPDC055321]
MQPAPLGTSRRLNRTAQAGHGAARAGHRFIESDRGARTSPAVPLAEVRTLPGLALTALALIAAALTATAAGHGWSDGALVGAVAAVVFLGAGIVLLVTEHGRAVRPEPGDE